jgi:hypothetical membrane protein
LPSLLGRTGNGLSRESPTARFAVRVHHGISHDAISCGFPPVAVGADVTVTGDPVQLRRLGLYCGIASPVLWLAVLLIAGGIRPDFSHLTNYVSELGERGSTTEAFVRYGGFVLTGLLYTCFAAAAAATFPRAAGLLGGALIALDGVGRVGAGIFPCEPGCAPVSGVNFHRLFATVGFVSGTLAAFVWGGLLRGITRYRGLARFSIASGVVAATSLVILTTTTSLAEGLFEHLATVALSIWLLTMATRLSRDERAGGSGTLAPKHH